jgi:hypothetical protein
MQNPVALPIPFLFEVAAGWLSHGRTTMVLALDSELQLLPELIR